MDGPLRIQFPDPFLSKELPRSLLLLTIFLTPRDGVYDLLVNRRIYNSEITAGKRERGTGSRDTERR